MTAIDNNGEECGEYMIKLGCDIKIRNKGDLSPLMLAAKKGNKKMFEILVNKGANINDKNILGETALSLAQANKHEDLALFILQRSKLKFKNSILILIFNRNKKKLMRIKQINKNKNKSLT